MQFVTSQTAENQNGFLGVSTDKVSVSVMEGDSVTLHTAVKENQQGRIKWYFNDIRIAQITGDLSFICVDIQCNEGTERFRDRLKLDHQSGSLTIMNTRTTDSGVYQLEIFSNSSSSGNIFNVTLHGVSAVETNEVKMNSGESVTLDPGLGLIENTNDLMAWYFNGTFIAAIVGNQSYICKDYQCDRRFRGRLKVDHQTGSLTIVNITAKHSGIYILQRSHISIINRFRVTVTGELQYIRLINHIIFYYLLLLCFII
uniref:Immunoglobulin domain-containing protein n=1 Tax=Sinocyclocheilus rhinocerous TaxID=307959 RepID=A0A673HN06_9TELE